MSKYNFGPSGPFYNGIPLIPGMPLGIGTGEVFHLFADVTDYYYHIKRGVKRGHAFITLAEAEDAMVSDRGDTLIVYPGDHVQTASLTWDKDNTAIIGAGSPNQHKR